MGLRVSVSHPFCKLVRSLRRVPKSADLWGMQHSLQNDAILLCLLLQCPELLRGRLRRVKVELHTNPLKAYWHLFGNSQGSLQVHITADGYFNVSGWNSYRCRDQLTGKLRTGRQSSKQKIARTSCGPGSANSFLGFRLIDRATNINLTTERRASLATFRGQLDPRTSWIATILLFQGFCIDLMSIMSPKS